MRLRRNKKRPLLQSLAVSYLLVLTPMLLLCYALYRSQYSSLESSMSEMQYAQLHRYQGAIQSELTDLNLLSNQLYITVSQTNVAIRSRQDLQSTDHTTMLRLRNQISNTLRTAKSTEEILLYLGRNGYGITSLRALPLEQLYALTKDHESLWKSWDELVAMLQSYRQAGLHRSGDTLYFLTGLGNDACALFNLKPDYLIDLYGETSSDEFFALTTLEGDILFQNHAEFPLDTAALAAGSEPEGASDWLITRLRLQNFDYYVISLRSRAALRGALLSQTAQLLPAIVVCTLISFLIIFYSVRRNYNPVAEVLRMANVNGLNIDEGNHEFAQLNTLLQLALEDRQKLVQHESQTRLRHDGALLYAQLATPRAAQAVASRFAHCQKNFQNPYWCYIEMALVDNGGTQNSETAFSLAQELLLEMLDQNFNVVSLCTQQGLMFLTGLPSPDDPYPLLLKNDLQKAIVFLREEYTAEFSCRVTAVVPAGEDFSRTSAMLMEQLSQMRLLPYSSPLQLYQELSPIEAQLLSALFSMEQSILAGDENAVRLHAAQLNQLVERASQQKNDRAKKMGAKDLVLQQVIQLVQSNYYDPNLNVSTIAQQLGRHPDDLSRIFRQSMQIGPLEYIHSVRIQAAIKLLKDNPGMTIRRIAELCGYVSIDSFNRAFKRITGTTASKYRESLESKDPS